jgi:aminoglycoside/choline kinase family phosphotransferase
MPQELEALYLKTFGQSPDSILELPGHGSDRRYFRLSQNGSSVMGTVNADVAENRAFIAFGRHFGAHKLPVPEILGVSDDEQRYLQTDLGDITLFEALKAERGEAVEIPQTIHSAYEKVVEQLPQFQIRASRDLDYSACYPRAAFDAQSMQWDLNYFKYYFLRLAGVPFHEQSLEDDFANLIDYLIQAPSCFFLYRDFQSRNIMLKDGSPWFIDFQGGRKGALAYDIASLLLDAKANLPFEFREQILLRYLESAQQAFRQIRASDFWMRHVDVAEFRPWFTGFSLIRILQAMGAYGFRGFHEKKVHFLQSVPFAIRNLEYLLGQWDLPLELPELRRALERITQLTRLREIAPVTVPLQITLTSFSYKNGYPFDDTGHGGGFVFDCRCLPNPGREPELAVYTGRDPIIQRWLSEHQELGEFLAHVRLVLRQSVDSYHARNFTHLSISFGCTGGRHRSVYCAEQIRKWLMTLSRVSVHLVHRELEATAIEPPTA